jgi:hypothetical protein
MLEKTKEIIKKLTESECCPNCTNIENCRAYNQNGRTRFPEEYKWSERCCEKCADITCLQNPFYILTLLKKGNPEDTLGYHKEALQTILSS